MERGNSQGMTVGYVNWGISGDRLTPDEMSIIDSHISRAVKLADEDVRMLRLTSEWWTIIAKELQSIKINPLKPPSAWEVAEYIATALRVRHGAFSVAFDIESNIEGIAHIAVEVEPGLVVNQKIRVGIIHGNTSKPVGAEHSVATPGS